MPGGGDHMDMSALFEQLFGGGAFDHIFGKVELMLLAGEVDPQMAAGMFGC